MGKNVRGEILHLEREQVRAINRGDVRSALKLFDRGFVGFSSTKHQRIRGLGALRKTFEYYLKRAPKLAYHMEQPHVSVSGGTAVAMFYWSVQLGRGRPGRTTGTQKARKIHGRGTHVFAKQGKEWKVVHEHFSRAPR
jgi:ketosteroid isomerase-like protein